MFELWFFTKKKFFETAISGYDRCIFIFKLFHKNVKFKNLFMKPVFKQTKSKNQKPIFHYFYQIINVFQKFENSYLKEYWQKNWKFF